MNISFETKVHNTPWFQCEYDGQVAETIKIKNGKYSHIEIREEDDEYIIFPGDKVNIEALVEGSVLAIIVKKEKE